MPTKTTTSGRDYEIDGKKFIWHPLDEDGAGLADVTIPLRIKLKVVRELAGQNLDDAGVMFDLLERIAPGQSEAMDEMDLNDFTEMFATWQDEYARMSGASLGEASGSSS